MNNEEYQIELIEKKLENALTSEELKEFEKLSTEDQTFLALYKEMEVMISGVENSARKSMLTDLKRIEEQLPEIKLKESARSKQTIRWIVWTAAAACIAGIVITVSLVTSNNGFNADRIYADFYKPYNSMVVSNSRSDEKATTLQELAYQSYADGNYTKAIGQLEELKKTNQEIEIPFFLANAYMATGQMAKAEENFNLVLAQESLLTDQTKWFLALCYLKTNHLDKAKAIFKELANYDNAYMKNAKEILHLVK